MVQAAVPVVRDEAAGSVLTAQLAYPAAAGNKRNVRTHGLPFAGAESADPQRDAVNLSIVRIIRGFYPKIVPAESGAGKKQQRKRGSKEMLPSSAAQVIALQLLALDAQHGGNQAQKGAAPAVVVNTDPGYIPLPTKLSQIRGKAFFHRVSALVHDEGDNTAEISAALKKVPQLSIEIA